MCVYRTGFRSPIASCSNSLYLSNVPHEDEFELYSVRQLYIQFFDCIHFNGSLLRFMLILYHQIHKADFTFPPWFSTNAKKLIKRILDPNPSTVCSYLFLNLV